MLVLSRKVGQAVVGTITAGALEDLLKQAQASGKPIEFYIEVIALRGSKIRLGFQFPEQIGLLREEVEPLSA